MPNYEHEQEIMRRDAFQIPANIEPVGTRCIQVSIPDDDDYEAEFFAVLTLLCKWNSYVKDPLRRATKVATLWRKLIWGTYKHCDGTRPDFLEVEDELQLRIKPDDPCIIQSLCGDGTWMDWYNPKTCIPEATAQPHPKPAPAVGDCLEFDAFLGAGNLWHLPTPVSGDDTIEVSNVQGGWTDDGVHWYCPDGSDYTLGLCSGAGSTEDSDPAPTIHHMRLIAALNGGYVDAYNTTITVPTGLAPTDIVFEDNDSTGSGPGGTISFHVKVCHNSPAPVTDCTEYDFAGGNGGWEVIHGDSVFGHYTAGSPGYWESQYTEIDSTHKHEMLRIKHAWTGSISSFKVRFDAAQPGYFEICDHEDVPENTFCPFLVAFPAGVGQEISFSIGITVADHVRIDLAHDYTATENHFKLYSVELCP